MPSGNVGASRVETVGRNPAPGCWSQVSSAGKVWGRYCVDIISASAEVVLLIPRIPLLYVGYNRQFQRAIKRRPSVCSGFLNTFGFIAIEMYAFDVTRILVKKSGRKLESGGNTSRLIGKLLYPPCYVLDEMRVAYSWTLGLVINYICTPLIYAWLFSLILTKPVLERMHERYKPLIHNACVRIAKRYFDDNQAKFKKLVGDYLDFTINKKRLSAYIDNGMHKVIFPNSLIGVIVRSVETDNSPQHRLMYAYMGKGLSVFHNSFNDYAQKKPDPIILNSQKNPPVEFIDLTNEITDERGNFISRIFANASVDKDFEYVDINKSQMKNFSIKFWHRIFKLWIEEYEVDFPALVKDRIIKVFEVELSRAVHNLYKGLEAPSARKAKSPRRALKPAVHESPSQSNDEVLYAEAMTDQATKAYIEHHFPVEDYPRNKFDRLKKRVADVLQPVTPAPRPVPVLSDRKAGELIRLCDDEKIPQVKESAFKRCITQLAAIGDWQSSKIARRIMPITVLTDQGKGYPVYHWSVGEKYTDNAATVLFANIDNRFVLLGVAAHVGLSSGATVYTCFWQNPQWGIPKSIAYNKPEIVRPKNQGENVSYQSLADARITGKKKHV